MSRFDGTQSSRIDEAIGDKVKLIRVGRVTEVNPRDTEDADGNHHVDVEWPPGVATEKYRDVSISQPASGVVYVPETGDLVLLQFRDGEGEKPIVTDTMYGMAPEHRAPLAEAGMIRMVRGDKYAEMHPDGDWVRIAQKTDDNATPDFKVEINDDGVHITGDEVSVDADTIISNGGGNIVATEGDSITGDGHDHGGDVSSDTVTGTVDSKDDGDIEVDQ